MPRCPQLTDAQRAYLRAFDRHLRAATPGEADRSRLEMNEALAPVLAAANLTPTGHQQSAGRAA